MRIRPIRPDEVAAAAALLSEAYRQAGADGWTDEAAAARALARQAAAEPEGTLVADAGGAVAGIGCVRIRGEIATVGPLAVAGAGRGTGGTLLDALVERADAAGCSSVRAHVAAADPGGFALCASRQFQALEVIATVERPAGPPPRTDIARGLEVGPARAADREELGRFDQKLTGHQRANDLASALLVARRRGGIVGYLSVAEDSLGPAVAVDSSDLLLLVARALAERGERSARARLSTASPVAIAAALALGFRVVRLGCLMSRGAAPPARPPQLYSIDPEIL